MREYLDISYAHLMSLTGGMMSPLEYREMIRSVIYEGKMPPKKKPSSGAKGTKTAPSMQAPPPDAVKALKELRKQMQQQADGAVK